MAAWAPWDMPDGTFQRVYDQLSADDRRALRAVSKRGKVLVNAHARAVDLAPAGGCNWSLRKKDAKALLDAGPMYQLRSLECRYGTFGVLSARRLVMTPVPRLRALDLMHSDLDAGIIGVLAGSPLRLTLEKLRVAACGLELEEAAALSAVTWPALRSLGLSHNFLNFMYGDSARERRETIADALVASTPSLQSLDVSHTGDFAASCLARLAGWPGLEELRIKGLRDRLGLPPPGGRGLKVLDLGGSHVEDQDFLDFVASNSATLESLSLAECRVSCLFGLRAPPKTPPNCLRRCCSSGSCTPWSF